MRLRPASPNDAPRLREVVRAAYAHYVERMGWEPRPMNDDYDAVVARDQVVVAESDGAIVGLVVLTVEEGDRWIDNVAVDPSVRGTGVGRALLEHAETVARQEGRAELWLLTHERMTENLALYARIGYAEDHRRSLDDGSELVIMRKPLT